MDHIIPQLIRNTLVHSFMGVKIADLINTFLAQCCMYVGKSGHERVYHLANMTMYTNRDPMQQV